MRTGILAERPISAPSGVREAFAALGAGCGGETVFGFSAEIEAVATGSTNGDGSWGDLSRRSTVMLLAINRDDCSACGNMRAPAVKAMLDTASAAQIVRANALNSDGESDRTVF